MPVNNILFLLKNVTGLVGVQVKISAVKVVIDTWTILNEL